MQLDRDLNVAVVRALYPAGATARRGWEMLAATGVRGLRLVAETGAFTAFDFTEQNPAAFEVLERNVREVGREGLAVHLADARSSPAESAFDYIDLDPFGTPAPFIGAALGALAPHGILAVTATDMPVLAGVARGVCEVRYGGRPVRGSQGPEGGLRILLAYLVREGSRRGIQLTPLLSYIHDHHVRAFVRAVPEADGGHETPPVGDPTALGDAGPAIAGTGPFGPMWLGPLFDPAVIRALEVPSTAERPKELDRFLARLREEVAADRPFCYEPNMLASELALPEPPPLLPLLSALRARGFAAGRSHVRASAFRTTAPRVVVHEAARSLRLGR
jgi:tRNA (guanine26-N2/guanine27-N2)-dimethyltransferase